MATGHSNLLGLSLIRQFDQSTRAANTSMERLATGKRINRASDDPSGLIASQGLGAQSSALRAEIARLERESIMLDAREGAMSVVGDLLIDLNGLVVQAANTGAETGEAREAMQAQASGLIQALEHVYSTSVFNGQRLFEGQNPLKLGSVLSPADGADAAPDLGYLNLGDLREGGKLNLVTGDLGLAQAVTESAIKANSSARGAIGAQQKNFYGSQLSVLHSELQGVEAARSTIRDTDYGKEIGALVRSQVLAEAAVKVIQIARETAATTVLGLIGAPAATIGLL